jgi:hypothetical protein
MLYFSAGCSTISNATECRDCCEIHYRQVVWLFKAPHNHMAGTVSPLSECRGCTSTLVGVWEGWGIDRSRMRQERLLDLSKSCLRLTVALSYERNWWRGSSGCSTTFLLHALAGPLTCVKGWVKVCKGIIIHCDKDAILIAVLHAQPQRSAVCFIAASILQGPNRLRLMTGPRPVNTQQPAPYACPTCSLCHYHSHRSLFYVFLHLRLFPLPHCRLPVTACHSRLTLSLISLHAGITSQGVHTAPSSTDTRQTPLYPPASLAEAVAR